MSNPFVLAVGDIPTGLSEPVDAQGASPVPWGGNMLGVAEGAPVEVHGTLANLGEAIMANLQVSGEAKGTCSRCLQELSTTLEYSISDVFGLTPDFITDDSPEGDDAEDEEEPLLVQDNAIDITQLVIDEAGLNAPFSPVCADFGAECREDTPAPDGISEEAEEDDRPDPRWAGLEKFKNL
ncbi:YceD family protein [Corynebacterium jeikeium]|uniref:YceD family protein n=1 Tax=Corynebacterium jeikeium TaxID=38289 RepID=UPI00055767DA|nr:DUF177 domain-containing protein [Corynebacterium jeikeium]